MKIFRDKIVNTHIHMKALKYNPPFVFKAIYNGFYVQISKVYVLEGMKINWEEVKSGK